MALITSPQSLQPEQALELLEGIIAQSDAEGITVTLKARDKALSRFSENQLTQNMETNKLSVTITSYYGQRSASAYTTDLTPASLAETRQISETMARLAPEDPEWMPLLEPQSYEDRLPGYSEVTANFSPLARGEIVQQVCTQAKQGGVESSGIISTDVSVTAIANSAGLRGVGRTTDADFSVTAKQGNGSSWLQRSAIEVTDIPVAQITAQVIEKAIASRDPREVQPQASGGIAALPILPTSRHSRPIHAEGEQDGEDGDWRDRRQRGLRDRRARRRPLGTGRNPLGRPLGRDPHGASRWRPDGFPAPARAGACADALHCPLPRQHRCAETARRDRRDLDIGLRVLSGGDGTRPFRHRRPVRRPHLRAREILLRPRPRRPCERGASDLPAPRRRRGGGGTRGRHHSTPGRDLSLHGGAAVLHARGIEAVPRGLGL